jgi:predicted kinase
MAQLVIINGGMGSGKSTITKLLSQNYNEQNYYLKVDDLIWGFSDKLDKNEAQELVFKLSLSMVKTLLESNISVFVEKVMNKSQVESFLEIAKIYKIKTTQIVLTLPFDLAITRIKARREIDGKSVSEEYLERVKKSHLTTDEITGIFDSQIVFSTETESPEMICGKILTQISLNN